MIYLLLWLLIERIYITAHEKRNYNKRLKTVNGEKWLGKTKPNDNRYDVDFLSFNFPMFNNITEAPAYEICVPQLMESYLFVFFICHL